MEKKYELTDEQIEVNGQTLYRIRALRTFADINVGELGGYVASEKNLSQIGNAWVCGDARVYGNARVCGYAQVHGDARVYGDAQVYGDARVCGDAQVYDDARVCGDARVYGDAQVCGRAKVNGNAQVGGNAQVYGDAQVCGNAWVYGGARVGGNAQVDGDAQVYGYAWVCGNAWVCTNKEWATATGFGSICRTTAFFRTKDDGVGVRCGCFCGTLDEFRAKVRETYPDDKLGREYLMLADLMEYRFGDGGADDGD